MSVYLEDYQDLLEDLGPHAEDVMAGMWQEATRAFSSRGLKQLYLDGARALHRLGRGEELVVDFLEESPEVARELGEEVVGELVATALSFSSKTSANVIALMLSTSSVAARRLGDPELFRGYLRLLDELIAQAPRGVRPMLDHLDELLSQLTLGGLRRWALWGAQAHKNDYEAQVAYFGLETPEAKSVLQNERRGTLFVNVQRRINIYLRALWGRDFFMRPTSGDYETREGYQPYIDGYTVHLPDAYDDLGELGGQYIDGLYLYRAAAAHAAAHMVYTREAMPDEYPGGVEGALVEVFEDARVETLAHRRFPGLLKLWRPLHTASPADGEEADAILGRLARALLDPDYDDPHPFIRQARDAFFERAETQIDTNRLSWELGHELTRDFPSQYISIHHQQPDVPYRDDNRYMWQFGQVEADESMEAGGSSTSGPTRQFVSVMEMVNQLDVEGAGDDAQEVWVLPTEFYRHGEEVSVNEQEGKMPVSLPFHYHEWDYQMQLERPHWCTLLERRPLPGDPEQIEAIVEKHKPLISRLKYLIEALQPQGVQRLRKQPEGDDLDLNAAVDAMIDLRMGEPPEERVHIRNLRTERDLSVLVLIDLSESTNELVPGTDTSVLDLAREATALLAGALTRIGDPFAIHGFDSAGRHDVEYYVFKPFNAPYNEHAKARLAGMTGQLSTRMGPAIRHAGEHLRKQPTQKKLLLLITDGEPADIDVRDPQYLRQDAKKAVEEVARHGVYTFAVSLDPNADEYVQRIFGIKDYTVVDRIERLPEKLPLLYAGLTR